MCYKKMVGFKDIIQRMRSHSKHYKCAHDVEYKEVCKKKGWALKLKRKMLIERWGISRKRDLNEDVIIWRMERYNRVENTGTPRTRKK